MAANFGVFIRSTQNNDEIIAACNNWIKDTKFDGRILRAKKDVIYGGLKVYFSEEFLIQELLQKKFLCNPGDLSTIHPLITHLTVHDASFSTQEEKFIENLRKKIRDDMGTVLEVSKVPFSKLHPDIGDGNWRVTLDIPEIEDLDVFKKVGLPDDYLIDIPETLERSSVTFHCIRCEKDGHSQWRCKIKKEDIRKDLNSSISQSIKQKDSPVPSSPHSQQFFIRDREEEQPEQDSSSKSKPLMPRKKIREFESTIGKEEATRYCHSFPLAENLVKKETDDSLEGKVSKKHTLSSDDENKGPPAKKPRISFLKRNPSLSDDDSQINTFSKASSTTNDHSSIEIAYESTPSTSTMEEPNMNKLSSKHSADSVSTSNQLEFIYDVAKFDSPSVVGNDLDSNFATPVRKRKKPAQGIPVVIPERIKEIINNIGDRVLNVEQLEAFLNHVKKKSKPCDFARMYTSDVAGLKRQMEEISRQFYLIPDRGTNEELQFMKWYGNTLQRYYGTPSTRKRKVKK